MAWTTSRPRGQTVAGSWPPGPRPPGAGPLDPGDPRPDRTCGGPPMSRHPAPLLLATCLALFTHGSAVAAFPGVDPKAGPSQRDLHPDPLPPGAVLRLGIGGASRRGEPVTFSPDGRLLAAGSWDAVLLLDAATGRERAGLAGHQAPVLALAFAPRPAGRAGGWLLASAGADRTVRLWDTATSQTLRELRGHEGEVSAVAFSPDGRLLASGGSEGLVCLWDTHTGKPRELARLGRGVSSVAFSPAAPGGARGWTLAAGCWDGTVRLWDVSSGAERRLAGHASGVCSVAFSPDGRALVATSAAPEAAVQRWDVTTGKPLPAPRGVPVRVRSATFSPDGKVIAGGGADGTAWLWDAGTGKELRRVQVHDERLAVLSVAFSPDGKFLATASGALVRMLDTAAWEEVPHFSGPDRELYAVAFSPDGK